MIIKVKEPDRALIAVGEMWVYYDGIQRVRTFGWVTADNGQLAAPGVDIAMRNGVRMSVTAGELRQWVDDHWGTEREFADELWPDHDGDTDAQFTVRCVHALRDDGTMLLLLIEGEAYLLSDDGRTIDRL